MRRLVLWIWLVRRQFMQAGNRYPPKLPYYFVLSHGPLQAVIAFWLVIHECLYSWSYRRTRPKYISWTWSDPMTRTTSSEESRCRCAASFPTCLYRKYTFCFLPCTSGFGSTAVDCSTLSCIRLNFCTGHEFFAARYVRIKSQNALCVSPPNAPFPPLSGWTQASFASGWDAAICSPKWLLARRAFDVAGERRRPLSR